MDNSFRIWADKAHADSLRTGRQKKRVLYRCSNCQHRATKNQAKCNNGYCTHCGSVLKAFKDKLCH